MRQREVSWLIVLGVEVYDEIAQLFEHLARVVWYIRMKMHMCHSKYIYSLEGGEKGESVLERERRRKGYYSPPLWGREVYFKIPKDLHWILPLKSPRHLLAPLPWDPRFTAFGKKIIQTRVKEQRDFLYPPKFLLAPKIIFFSCIKEETATSS